MNQKEWLDYFETINDRKPTPAEMQEALANGDFVNPDGDSRGSEQTQVVTEATNTGTESATAVQEAVEIDQAGIQSQPAPKKKVSKKIKIIISVVAGVLAFLLLSIGGFATWTYQSGKIPAGTYQLSAYRYYDDDEEKMVDGMEDYRQANLELLDFVTITGNKFKTNNYTESSNFEIVDFLDYETDNDFTIDPWSHTLVRTWSLSDYKKIVNELYDKNYRNSTYISSSDIKKYKDNSVDYYKDSLESTYRYKLEGDNLIITRYNKKGKVEAERTFKRLSEDETRKVNFDYDKAVRKDKELYKS